ncbi:transposase [Leuconostoc citreum]|nr:transposase [Leuconostoc citreum]
MKLDDLLTLIGLKGCTYYYLESHLINTSSDNKIADVIRQVKSPQFQNECRYLRMKTLLHDQGYLFNHKRVLRIMNQSALISTKYNTRKPRNNSYRGAQKSIKWTIFIQLFSPHFKYGCDENN